MARHVVEVGEGTVQVVMEGDGPVTVIFENGMATPLEEWDAVTPCLAGRARVLRYDHRYASPRGTVASRSVSDVLGDLERLLEKLAVKPPYLLVGHSWGGVIARLFAHAHPSDVVGLVFVDATHEAIDPRTLSIVTAMYGLMLIAARAKFVRRGLVNQLCPPASSAAYRARIEGRLSDPVQWPIGLRTARAESAAIPGALDQLRRVCSDLPAVPVHVLTAGGVKSKSAQRVHAAWKAAVARSAMARYTSVPTSGHYLPIECPDVVADAIMGVLADSQQLRHRSV